MSNQRAVRKTELAHVKRPWALGLASVPVLACVAVAGACSSNGSTENDINAILNNTSGSGRAGTNAASTSSEAGGASATLLDAGLPLGDGGTEIADDVEVSLADAGALSCAAPSVGGCSDGQAIAIDEAVSRSEIALAEQVLKQGVPGPASAFAARMIADHSQSLQKWASIGIAPVENANSIEITEEGRQTAAALMSETGAALANDYINQEALDHTMALATIDHMLVPSVQTPAAVSQLKTDRDVVAEHLRLALTVQAFLEGPCGGTLTDAGAPDAAASGTAEAGAGEAGVATAEAGTAAAADAGTATADASDAGTPFTCDRPRFRLCSDGQVVAIAAASNQGEVDLAQLVLSRGLTGPAATFAQQMIADHTMLLRAGQQAAQSESITPTENAASSLIRLDSQNESTELSMESGDELARSYVNHEVLDHLLTLGNLDRLLIPSVGPGALRDALIDARAVVANHLTQVVQLQTMLEGACGGTIADAGAVLGDAGAQAATIDGGAATSTGGTTGTTGAGATGGATTAGGGAAGGGAGGGGY